MAIKVGDKLPGAKLLELGEDGPAEVNLEEALAGRKVALFGLPGAYTGTCTNAHVPGFMRAAEGLREKGVEAIICVSVNDPFVMSAWGKFTGGADAGIRFLGDSDGAFTKAIGLEFSAPPAGLINRSQRYSMLVEDGVVKILNVEDSPGVAEKTSGEALLAAL